MTGILVVNAYLKSEKFDTLYRHLISSAAACGIDLQLRTNEEVLLGTPQPDFALFWDKDVNAARRLENRGVPVLNSARAIALCDDKAKTYLALENTVLQPKTVIAPLSFYAADYTAFIEQAVKQLGLPLVYKECCGSFGEQVYLCHTLEDIQSHLNGKPFLLQEFIRESAGEDVRIEVVGGKAVAAMKRSNPDDFRSNITNGGTAVPYQPTQQEAALAVRACEALGLAFGGVDILNHSLVCEVNSNAHIINLMRVTGVDVAPLIFKYIAETV